MNNQPRRAYSISEDQNKYQVATDLSDIECEN